MSGYYSYEGGVRTPRSRIDALIDFYERHKTGAGTRIPVGYSCATIEKALGLHGEKRADGTYLYRGRILVPQPT